CRRVGLQETEDASLLWFPSQAPAVAPAMAGATGGGVRHARLGGDAGRGVLRRRSTRASAAALPAEGEAGDPAVHVRWPVPPGHVRSQAVAGARQWPAVAALDAPARALLPQSHGEPRGIAFRVSPARRERTLDQLALPPPGA